MGLNETPSSERLHIAFFGKRNAGKSSIVNAVTNQEISVVSDVLGTTTDPVLKAMELLPLGPVMIIDTAGIDDVGDLGKLRVEKTYEILNKTDIAILVVDSATGKTIEDEKLIERFKEKNIDYIVVYNKSDIKKTETLLLNEISVSAKTKENIEELKNMISSMKKEERKQVKIIGDFIKEDDVVLLITPIDESAPKGRLILPQQQTIRDILDSSAISITVKETQIEAALSSLSKKPALAVCDSQVFKICDSIIPCDIPLTSFSILFARYKGDLMSQVKGAMAIEKLEDGDTVLISEGCTHHRQCNDIGTVKLPNMIKKYTGKDIKFEFTQGTAFESELSKYKMIIHCGGCMLNDREMKNRLDTANRSEIPITNYGVMIAYINGILKRSIDIFPEIRNLDI